MVNETICYDITSTKGRQIELDIVKGLSIFFMFIVHCYEQFYVTEIMDKGMLVHFIRFFGGPLAAPVFMTCMGISMNYTRNNTPDSFIRRGIKLFFAGYLLQIGRDMIPFILKWWIHNESSYLSDGIYYTFGNDIMVFAGLAFIFMGLFKKSRLHDKWLIVFYLIAALLNVLLKPIQFPDNELFAVFTGLLWGSWENSWFPFFTWIFYPIMGYFFGRKLLSVTNKDEFYKKNLFFALPCIPVLIVIMYHFHIDFGALNWLFHTSYYQHNWYGNIFIFCCFLVWISAWHFLYKYLPAIVRKTLIRWSSHINTMYCVQWIFLGFLSIIVPYYVQPLWVVGIIIVCALTISDFISYRIRGY